MIGNNKRKRGISLIVLIIVIVIIVILTTTVMVTVINTGIIDNAKEAVILNTIGNIKEEIAFENQNIILNGGKVGTLEEKYVEGKVTRSVQELEEGSGEYYIYYVLSPNSYSAMGDLGKGTAASRKDIFVIDEYGNIKYINNKGKEYGDKVDEKILEDETHIRFKNKAFGAYVSSVSGATEEDMIFQWMKTQTSLTIEDKTVTSLEDLVFFPNLTNLKLGRLTLENLDGIENCTKLTSLNFSGTKIKNYDKVKNISNLNSLELYSAVDDESFGKVIESLKDLTNFKYLRLWHNDELINLKEIGKLKNLNRLVIEYSNINIMNIDVIGELKSLKTLTISQNKGISSIEFIKNLTNLETLELVGDNISDITPISSCTNLKTLTLQYNSITDITPLSKCINLTFLDLKGNVSIDGNRENYTPERLEALDKIGEILDRDGTINIDIDKIGLFTNYKTLDLSGQNMTNLLPLKGLTELTDLNLTNNQITLEDEESKNILSSMTKLKKLDLSKNNVTDIRAINSLNNLASLKLFGDSNKVNLVEIEDIISNLISLQVNEEDLPTILDCDTKKITKLILAGDAFSYISKLPDNFYNLTSLVYLGLSGNKISNLNIIENMSQLLELNLSNTNLHDKMIDFSRLTNLTYLNLNNNTLWSDDLDNLKELRNNTNLKLYLQNNAIIDASALLELDSQTKIFLSGNVNLSENSKEKLRERFGGNISF